MEIPKTTSGPARPDEPSFLTTLPSEIRNRIYEFLFERDEPVLLHDEKAYWKHLLEEVPQDNTGPSDIFDNDANAEIDIEKHIKDNEFKHCFGECIRLL
jgi:hypothetical protein